MKGYPKVLKTKEDYYNCLALVQQGELKAGELKQSIEALENKRYVNCKVIEIAADKKLVTVMYCNEAAIGSEYAVGEVKGTILAVEHNVTEPKQEQQPDTTIITLSREIAADTAEIKVLSPVDILAAMEMTTDELTAIKGVLKQYE